MKYRVQIVALAALLLLAPPVKGAGLVWQTRPGYRAAPLVVPAIGRSGFTLLSNSALGIHFTNSLPFDRASANHNFMNGAGLAAADVDGDGFCDLYFCNLTGGGRLYRNLGNGQFADITEQAGVMLTNMTGTGAVFADINGDGFPDLLVSSCGGPNACFLNNGKGHFTNITESSGLVQKAGGTTMTLADIDGNGTLDLYVANYGETSILRTGGALSVRTINGRPVVSGRFAKRIKILDGQMYELGEPDVLYLNDGKGKFTPVPWTGGAFLDRDGQPLAEAPWDMGLSAMFRDMNGDGFPDLYVCNDFQTPDRIWINDGHGKFRALPRPALRSTSRFSMTVDFADINRDGLDDFFVADMLSRSHVMRMTQLTETNAPAQIIGETDPRPQIRRNTLFLNRGDGTYAETACLAGLDASDWTWNAVFLDVDLDGYEDLLIANGHAYDTQDLDVEAMVKSLGQQPSKEAGKNLALYPPLRTPNLVFRNRGDLTFQETGAAWGFDSTQVSHGIALVDLDHDGDLDVVVNCLNAPPLIYRNDSSAPRVAVRLRGAAPNTRGIGAKIKVLGGAVPMQSQEMICGGHYLSGDDAMRVFAAGGLTNRLTIEVTWRNGTRSFIPDAAANFIYEVDEAGAVTVPKMKVPEIVPLFKDVSALLNHSHQEEPFDDFARQPLLTRRLSQLGPGVAWFDLDGDGRDELIVGGGRGGALAVFRADGKGGFTRLDGLPLADDLTGLAGWTPVPGQRALLAALANYESGSNTAAVLNFSLAKGNATPTLLPPTSILALPASPGPLAIADYDGDGQLDLFAGGRVIPGRYPETAASHLFRNDGGKLTPDAANNRLLEKAGLVTGAVWSDLDSDSFPELILACEWGPVKIFKNDHGKLAPWNPPVRLNGQTLALGDLTGWWTGVTTGDLDGDGRPDLIVGNWGLNTPWRASETQPARLYYGNFTGAGGVDLIEAEFDIPLGKIAPREQLKTLAAALPFLRARFPTHKSFSTASVVEMLGDNYARAAEVRATTLASMVFLNRGDHFEAMPLPAEGQFAPVYGVAVADADGDGREDVFLSQNFTAGRVDPVPMNAGRGLWLRGTGAGRLAPMSGVESGITVYGDQRGAALCDFDEDGRVDLVVAQNGAATKLFHNERAIPGLRVRLQGPPGNPTGIGASVRLLSGEKSGPARELHAGSGHWSQDGAVPVLSGADATRVWVRWPGGKITETKIPAGAKEVTIQYSGGG